MLKYSLLSDIHDGLYDSEIKPSKNNYKQLDSDLIGVPEQRHQQFTPYSELDEETQSLDDISKVIDLKYNDNISAEDDKYHQDAINHILTCPACRREALEKMELDYKEDFVSLPSLKNADDQVFDIVIYVLTGVFFIFILNLFLKLGKLLK